MPARIPSQEIANLHHLRTLCLIVRDCVTKFLSVTFSCMSVYTIAIDMYGTESITRIYEKNPMYTGNYRNVIFMQTLIS